MVVHLGPLPLTELGRGSAVSPVPAHLVGAPARAGFVVGRSVGGSVTRNRVSRRLRHLVAPLLKDLPDGSGLVVRALPAAAHASTDELARDLASGVRRCLINWVGHGTATGSKVSQ
jgi:ribonuclease P protein component